MFNRRNKFGIVNDVLEVVRSGKNKKTQIMYGANLSFKQIHEEYLPLVEKSGLLKIEHNENGGNSFQLTDKGNEFLKTYKNLIDIFSQS